MDLHNGKRGVTCAAVVALSLAGLAALAPLAPRGAQAQEAAAATAEDRRQYLKFAGFGCQADWNSSCMDERVFEAPDGLQACSISYSVGAGRASSINRAYHGVFAEYQQTPRFRGYKVKVFATGSRTVWDRWSSNANVNDVVLVALPYDATPEERFRFRCDAPLPPQSPQP